MDDTAGACWWRTAAGSSRREAEATRDAAAGAAAALLLAAAAAAAAVTALEHTSMAKWQLAAAVRIFANQFCWYFLSCSPLPLVTQKEIHKAAWQSRVVQLLVELRAECQVLKAAWKGRVL